VSTPVTWAELEECDPRDFTLATVPARFRTMGDPHAGIDDAPCALDALLELSKKQEAEGLGDAPWPPHYVKHEGEPKRVAPSRAKKSSDTTSPRAKGRRTPKHPLVTVAKAAKKEDALDGLDRWKARHPEVASFLEPADVLVDAMRGRYRTWTRVRVNLRHVPEDRRPAEEPPDPDYDPRVEWQRD
jgi:hypothetical protein